MVRPAADRAANSLIHWKCHRKRGPARCPAARPSPAPVALGPATFWTGQLIPQGPQGQHDGGWHHKGCLYPAMPKGFARGWPFPGCPLMGQRPRSLSNADPFVRELLLCPLSDHSGWERGWTIPKAHRLPPGPSKPGRQTSSALPTRVPAAPFPAATRGRGGDSEPGCRRCGSCGNPPDAVPGFGGDALPFMPGP